LYNAQKKNNNKKKTLLAKKRWLQFQSGQITKVCLPQLADNFMTISPFFNITLSHTVLKLAISQGNNFNGL